MRLSTSLLPRSVCRSTVDAANAAPLQVPRHQLLDHLQPDRIVQAWRPITGTASRLEGAETAAVGAAWRRCAPDWTSGPCGPSDVCPITYVSPSVERREITCRCTLRVIIHILNRLRQVLIAHSVIIGAKLRDHGLELVRLQPLREAGHIRWEALVADLVLAREVVVQVLVDVDGGVIDWVADHVQVIAGRRIAL